MKFVPQSFFVTQRFSALQSYEENIFALLDTKLFDTKYIAERTPRYANINHGANDEYDFCKDNSVVCPCIIAHFEILVASFWFTGVIS